MKTIRLPDPSPRGKEAQKLEFGSSAWAADSCLVEWSTLEREWLGVPKRSEPREKLLTRLGNVLLPASGWLGLVAMMAMAAWYFVD